MFISTYICVKRSTLREKRKWIRMNWNLGARHKVNATRDPYVIRKDAGKTWLPVFVYTRVGDHYDCIACTDDGYLIVQHTRNSIYRRNTMQSSGTPPPTYSHTPGIKQYTPCVGMYRYIFR